MSDYPEHEKLREHVSGKAMSLLDTFELLDWMSRHDISTEEFFAAFNPFIKLLVFYSGEIPPSSLMYLADVEDCSPVKRQFLFDYFDIDLRLLENEKEMMDKGSFVMPDSWGYNHNYTPASKDHLKLDFSKNDGFNPLAGSDNEDSNSTEACDSVTSFDPRAD